MPFLGGRLCEFANTNPLLPHPLFKSSFTAMNGMGAWAFMLLSYVSDSGAAKICKRGGGGKARERSDQAGGGCGRGVSVGRFLKICV